MGVHEDKLVPVADIGTVRVDSEDELAFAIVDGEAIAGEEERGL